MLNNKTLETNIGKLKNRICLRQLYQIKNGQNKTSLIHFKMVPIQFNIHLLKRKKGGEENKISKAADRNEI